MFYGLYFQARELILPSSTRSRRWATFFPTFCIGQASSISICISTWTPFKKYFKVSMNLWWCHKNTYERVIELVQPVFLNCTILKILKTLESLIAFSSFKVWPSIIDRRPIKIKKIWNGDDDDMAVDELSTELWFVHNSWLVDFLGWLDIINDSLTQLQIIFSKYLLAYQN